MGPGVGWYPGDGFNVGAGVGVATPPSITPGGGVGTGTNPVVWFVYGTKLHLGSTQQSGSLELGSMWHSFGNAAVYVGHLKDIENISINKKGIINQP